VGRSFDRGVCGEEGSGERREVEGEKGSLTREASRNDEANTHFALLSV
jgi:hypothetical protein